MDSEPEVQVKDQGGRTQMYRCDFNPFSECWRLFSAFAECGLWSGRRFYTRRERIEALEKLKKQLQDEITAIDEMIEDLKQAQGTRA